MTLEAQRIAIAEACGWHRLDDINWTGYNVGNISWQDIPNYLSDLNAMHEAEKVLYDKLNDYMYQLQKVCQPKGYTYKSAICATASQRAEAFLRTIGKWEDIAP